MGRGKWMVQEHYANGKSAKNRLKPDGLKLQNAHEVVLHLKAEAKEHQASHNNVRRIVNKFVWELKVGDINQSHHYNCNIINGSKGMH